PASLVCRLSGAAGTWTVGAVPGPSEPPLLPIQALQGFPEAGQAYPGLRFSRVLLVELVICLGNQCVTLQQTGKPSVPILNTHTLSGILRAALVGNQALLVIRSTLVANGDFLTVRLEIVSHHESSPYSCCLYS